MIHANVQRFNYLKQLCIIYSMRIRRSDDTKVTYVELPPRDSKKGILVRTALYAYLLIIILAVVLLPHNGDGSGAFDDLLYIAIAPLPIISIVYLIYFLFTGRDYRFKIGQPQPAGASIGTLRKILGFSILGLLLLYRLIIIHQDASIHGNYIGTGIGILFTIYLIWLFVKNSNKKNR
jgi:hypothetical protein